MDRNTNRKNRETLKGYFKKGGVPTEEQFAGLIDSVPNIVEDGQVQRTPDGWAFYPQHEGGMELALYKDVPENSGAKPAWRLRVTGDKRLVICNENEETVLEMAQDKTVSVSGGKETPTPAGDEGYFTIPADKKWHDVPVDFSKRESSCRVFSIHASCNDTIGLCLLTHATAVWMSNDDQHVRSHQKHWWGWTGAVKIRWQGDSRLQLRSRKRLGGDVTCRIVETFKV